jgi:hypothetical protein
MRLARLAFARCISLRTFVSVYGSKKREPNHTALDATAERIIVDLLISGWRDYLDLSATIAETAATQL